MDEDWGSVDDFNSRELESAKDEVNKPIKVQRRRNTELFEIQTRTEYRRYFGEAKILEAMQCAKFKNGHSYHFITAGDCDSLSFLMGVMSQCGKINHLIVSTWCMAADDILFFERFIQEGKIEKIDFYVGEIFPNSYKVEFNMLKNLTEKTKCGRVAVFRNHSKIFAADAEDFKFTIESSANINTNPRTEQAVITIDDEGYLFYKKYFDDIISFE